MRLRISLSGYARQFVSPVMDCNFIFFLSCPCFHTSPFFHPVLFLPYPSTGDRCPGGGHFCTVMNKRGQGTTMLQKSVLTIAAVNLNIGQNSPIRWAGVSIIGVFLNNDDFLNYYDCYVVIDCIVNNHTIRRLSILKDDRWRRNLLYFCEVAPMSRSESWY